MTHRGEVVLDPFFGSGSTLIAAERTGRLCCGVELDSHYVDLVLRRYGEVTGRPATLEGTGETLEELRARREREDREPDERIEQAHTAAPLAFTRAWRGV